MVAAAMALPLLAGAAAADIIGPARVSDGDTLVIGAVHIRLHGIDAPETGQSCQTAKGAEWDCGGAAKERMVELTRGWDVRCVARDRDRYGRVVARCAADGQDLGAVLVSEGLAWAYRRYSPDYIGVETAARVSERGIWQGKAQVAWDYRAGGWSTAASSAQAATGSGEGDCQIKGNINSKGVKIYHLPGSRWYANAQISESSGERWFCDEAEAEAAGWRGVRGN